jgi:hypothetical protein
MENDGFRETSDLGRRIPGSKDSGNQLTPGNSGGVRPGRQQGVRQGAAAAPPAPRTRKKGATVERGSAGLQSLGSEARDVGRGTWDVGTSRPVGTLLSWA